MIVIYSYITIKIVMISMTRIEIEKSQNILVPYLSRFVPYLCFDTMMAICKGTFTYQVCSLIEDLRTADMEIKR